MIADNILRAAVRGYQRSRQRLSELTPGGRAERSGEVWMLMTGTALDPLNTVSVLTEEWDERDLDALSERAAGRGQPWSIEYRPTSGSSRLTRVREIAAAHGLIRETALPFYAMDIADFRPRHPPVDAEITAVGSDRWMEYTETMTAGFEAPEGIYGDLMGGGVLDAPEVTGYIACQASHRVAVGLGATLEDSVGIWNVAVLPGHRSVGLGRAMTERVVLDGVRAGASLAYLHPSETARALYESMGFRYHETWTSFSA